MSSTNSQSAVSPFLFSFIFLLFATFVSEAQTAYRLGDFIEISGNQVKFHFDEGAGMVDEDCASFYRIGRIDSSGWSLSGRVEDYFVSDKLAFEGYLKNGFLYGKAVYFYENGEEKMSGHFHNSQKVGLWKYYYDNGQLKKELEFDKNGLSIISFYTRGGRQKVENGRGKYAEELKHYKSTSTYKVYGDVINGKPDGKWAMKNTGASLPFAYEVFSRGRFLHGVSQSMHDDHNEYKDYSRLDLSEFDPHESVLMLKNGDYCFDGDRISYPHFNRKDMIVFCEFLADKCNDYLKNNAAENQWVMFGLEVLKDGGVNIEFLNSTMNDEKLEEYLTLQVMHSAHKWSPGWIDDQPFDYPLFLTMAIHSNQAVSPDLLRVKFY